MLETYPFTAIVLGLALIVYAFVTLKVVAARVRFGVKAPATSGPPAFERRFRVHENTLEQIVLFVPSLLLFAASWGDAAAAIVGLAWPAGRIYYAVVYVNAPEARYTGWVVAFASSVILLLGGVIGAVAAAF